MKEKTFDEMIAELHNKAGRNFSMKEETAELMQQVREATIAECREAIRKEHKTYTPFETHYQLPLGEQLYNLNKIPNDRIITKK